MNALSLPTRTLCGLMGWHGPIYIDPAEVRALECNEDRTVSILMLDHRVYVSRDDIGVVLLSLGGQRPDRAVSLGADQQPTARDADGGV